MPFPSPVHVSESEVAQSHPSLSDPMDCSLPAVPWFLCPWDFQFSRQEYWSGVPLPSPSVGLALSYSVKPPQPGSLVGPVTKSTAIIPIRDQGQG